jgi:hypothetical protein
MSWNFPGWAYELAWLSEDDRDLPSALDAVNLVFNHAPLSALLSEFAEDKDVRNFLALDLPGTTAGLPMSSTGLPETAPCLPLRAFRLWEYVWLYKVLGLSGGGMKVLDLGGPATQLLVLTAIASCNVTTVDINPECVQAASECARAWKLPPSKTKRAAAGKSCVFIPILARRSGQKTLLEARVPQNPHSTVRACGICVAPSDKLGTATRNLQRRTSY